MVVRMCGWTPCRHSMWANRWNTEDIQPSSHIHFSWLLGLQQIDVMPSLSLVIQSWMWYADYSLSSIQCIQHCLHVSICTNCQLPKDTIASTANQSGDTNTVRWLHFVHLASYTPHSKCSEHHAYIGMRLRHNTTCAIHIEDCEGMVVAWLSWLNGKALAAQAKGCSTPGGSHRPFHFPLFWPHNI